MTGEAVASVVIATHNRRPLLAEAVESVHGQVDVPWELVVVDDASTDDTADFLAGLSRARSLRVGSHGERSRARNRGLGEARGKYVLFLDDDDLLKPAALSVLVSALDRHPEAVAAIGAREDWVVAEDYRGRDVHPLREECRPMFDELVYGWSAVPGQCLFRADRVRTLQGFDESIASCEDRDLLLRLSRRGRFVLCPQTVMTYRIRPDQIRPPDIRRQRERVARKAIRSLSRRERRRALVLRRCTALVDGAQDDVAARRTVHALAKLGRALALAPGMLLSPLIATGIARRLLAEAFRGVRKR